MDFHISWKKFINSKIIVSIFIYTIFSIIFIYFLEFVDISNFNSFIFNGSYLYLNQNPYSIQMLPFPPNFYLFLTPTFLVYIYSGYNLFYYIFSFKIFQLVISVLSSILIYKIVFDINRSEHRAKAAFLSFLFSPFIFYINYVRTEQDIFGIFFALLSLYILLIFRERKNDFVISLAGSIILWYSVFIYYFPAILIPSLLIYQKSKKKFVNLIISIFVGFFYFYLPLKIINFWDFIPNILGLSTISGQPSSYSKPVIDSFLQFFNIPLLSTKIVSLILPNISFVSAILVLISSFLIPFICKKLNYPIYFSFSFVIILLFILINNFLDDEYIWIVPFVLIALAISLKDRLLFWKLLLAQTYIIPYIFIFNIWGLAGFGAGTGFFYLSDLMFKSDIYIALLIWNPFFITKIVYFFAFISLILLIQILIKSSNNLRRGSNKYRNYYLLIKRINDIPRYIKYYINIINIKAKNIRSHLHFKNFTFFIGIIIIFLLLFANFSAESNFTISSTNSDFPLGIFQSSDNVMNQSVTYALINNNHAVYIAPNNYSWPYYLPGYNHFYFYRNLTNEHLEMNLNVNAIDNYGYFYNTTIFKQGTTKINLLNTINISNNSDFLSPYFVNNSTKCHINIPIIQDNSSIYTYNFTGNSVIFYSVSLNKYQGYKFYILFHSDMENWPQNEILALSYNNSFQVQLYGYLNTSTYILGYLTPGQPWKNVHFWQHQDNYWNLVSFYINSTSITFNLNNVFSQSINYNFSNKSIPLLLSVGKYWDFGDFGNYRFSLKGQTTSIIASRSNLSLSNKKLYVSYIDSKNNSLKSNYVPLINNTISFNYLDNNLKIVSNYLSLNVFNVTPILEFGRLSNSTIALTFQITYLHLSGDSPRSYFYNILIMNTVLPVYVTSYVFIRLKYKS